MHIRDHPEGDPQLDYTNLPIDHFGIPIPQDLSDDELNSMKLRIHVYMSNAFGVSEYNF